MSDKTVRPKKTARGIVVSDKTNKTIVVRVDRQVKHSTYGKYVIRSKHYYVHDEKNQAKLGDLVTMVETKPISKLKRWRMLEILRENPQARIGVQV